LCAKFLIFYTRQKGKVIHIVDKYVDNFLELLKKVAIFCLLMCKNDSRVRSGVTYPHSYPPPPSWQAKKIRIKSMVCKVFCCVAYFLGNLAAMRQNKPYTKLTINLAVAYFLSSGG
jgi:hypothetical protein